MMFARLAIDAAQPSAPGGSPPLWNKFPVWYHLTFLVSLVPLAYLGGQISALEIILVLDHLPVERSSTTVSSEF